MDIDVPRHGTLDNKISDAAVSEIVHLRCTRSELLFHANGWKKESYIRAADS